MTFQNISVVGAGTMGNGIAQVFAQNGFKVSIYDHFPEVLPKAVATIEKNLSRLVSKEKLRTDQAQAALKNIQTHTDLAAAVAHADLVVEAAIEDEGQKKALFQTLDQQAPSNAILASNTSSILIGRLEAAIHRKGQLIGMHFFNPVPMMRLVEVIRTPHTQQSVFEAVFGLAQTLGKVPVEVNDAPGFVANRVLMPMINEAANTWNARVAGIAEIDTVMQLGMAHPMGPLRLADFIGLDVCVAILEVLQTELQNDHYAPAPILLQLLAAGDLGQKSGRGFYDYSQDPKNTTPRNLR